MSLFDSWEPMAAQIQRAAISIKLFNVNDALIVIFLTCGCHICVHTHHKVELKDFESDTILSSRSQTLNILLCLGCWQGHHHWCNICIVFHPKVQKIVCSSSMFFPFYQNGWGAWRLHWQDIASCKRRQRRQIESIFLFFKQTCFLDLLCCIDFHSVWHIEWYIVDNKYW